MPARATGLSTFVVSLFGAAVPTFLGIGCNLSPPPADSPPSEPVSDRPAPTDDGVELPVPSPGDHVTPDVADDPIEEFASEDLVGFVVGVDGDAEMIDSVDLRALTVGTRVVLSIPNNAPAPTRQFGGGCECSWFVVALDGNETEPIGTFDPPDACTTTYTVLRVGDALMTATQTCGDSPTGRFSQGITAVAEPADVDEPDRGGEEDDEDLVTVNPGGGGGGGGGDDPAPLICGNGVIDSGEECDPPDGASCDVDCLIIRLASDGCENPAPVTDGSVAFTTANATTDGPAEDEPCDTFDVSADIWFCYTASCTGNVAVSLCDNEFDTTLAVYGDCVCPTVPAVACDDDGCPVGSGSRLTFAANLGESFLIRLGGFEGARGDGTLSISCDAAPLAAPTVSIEKPENELVTADTSTHVTGTATGAVSVVVNGVQAVLKGETFTATDVPLAEGTSVLIATAEGADGQTATDSRSIRRDTVAPLVVIESPRDGDRLISETVTVAGTVNDIIPGATINADDVTVTINGIEAAVNNRSFLLPDVPLALGMNSINARVLDRVGNVGDSSIEVTREPDLAGVRIVITGGNAQSEPINSQLSTPLSVRLETIDGAVLAGRPVKFDVSRGDGLLGIPDDSARMMTLLTDGKGEAAVDFVVGSRTGQGFHRVRATTPGSLTFAEFCVTAQPAAPSNIVAVMLPPARGVTGGTLRDPLSVIVTDEGGNPVPGVLVTFDAVFGDGDFDGQASVQVMANMDGIANALWTLGPEPGVANNEVITTFDGNPGLPVTFNVSGIAVGDAGDTTVSGIVQNSTGDPIVGARAVIRGTDLFALTGPDGKFTITDVQPGGHHVGVLGSAANDPANGIFFPDIDFAVGAIAGVDNMIDPPIVVLPFLDTAGAKLAGGDEDVVLTMAGVAGFAIKVFAHSTFVLDAETGDRVQQPLMMSSSQVKFDKVPMPPPQGSTPMLVGTLQPSGVLLDPPAQVTYPNVEGLAPGDVADVFAFHHDIGQFVNIGPGTVSEDGSVVASDPGFGIVQSGWHCLIRMPGPSARSANGCSVDFIWRVTDNGRATGANKPVMVQATCDPDRPVTTEIKARFSPPDGMFDSNEWTGVSSTVTVVEQEINGGIARVVLRADGNGGSESLTSPLYRVMQEGKEDITCQVLIDAYFVKLKIEKMWSDQSPGLGENTNFLPGGAGAQGNFAGTLVRDSDSGYVLLGARSDEAVHTQARISLTPDIPEIRDKLLMGLLPAKLVGRPIPLDDGSLPIRVSELQGLGSLAGDVVSIRTPAMSASLVDYAYEAGLDLDGDGRITDNSDDFIIDIDYFEAAGDRLPRFRFVSFNVYLDQLILTEGGQLLTAATLPIASAFLDAFLDDDVPLLPIFAVNDVLTSEITIPGGAASPLDHNVGVVWDASGNGTLRLHHWIPGSTVSTEILKSSIFNGQLKLTLQIKSGEVRTFFNDNPESSSHVFTFPMTLNQAFSQRRDKDLFFAMGTTSSILTLTVNVRASDLAVTSLQIQGQTTDVYDWNLEKTKTIFGVTLALAAIQAGYDTLGEAGHIFEVFVEHNETRSAGEIIKDPDADPMPFTFQ